MIKELVKGNDGLICSALIIKDSYVTIGLQDQM